MWTAQSDKTSTTGAAFCFISSHLPYCQVSSNDKCCCTVACVLLEQCFGVGKNFDFGSKARELQWCMMQMSI